MDETLTDIIEEINFRIKACGNFEKEYISKDLPEAATNARNRKDELVRLMQFIDDRIKG